MMKNGNAVSLAGGIIGLVSFALPWITDNDTRYTAYELIVVQPFLGRDTAPTYFFLWCLLLGAIIVILASLLAPREELTAQRWNLAGAILGWVAILSLWGQLLFTTPSPTVSVSLSVGSWMVTLAFILALSGAISAWLQERAEQGVEELERLRQIREKEAERARARENT